MKYFLSVIALLTFTFSLQSALGVSSRHLSTGDAAPAATLSNASTTVKLGHQGSGQTLVAFWSASDAASRTALARYAAYISDHSEANINLAAVCLDDDPELAAAVAQRDGVSSSSLFVPSAAQAQELAISYGLTDSYGAVLIGPDGRIQAFNPSVDSL